MCIINKLMKHKKIFLSLPIVITPFFTVISCVSESTKTNSKLEETTLLADAFKANNQLISSKNLDNAQIKNFVNLTSWSDVDSLISNSFLGKYFNVSRDFKTLLSNNDFKIYKQIKRVTIQPKRTSRNLDLIFYLGSPQNDSNIVTLTIENALVNPFEYVNSISISKKSPVELYKEKKDFDDAWAKVSDFKNVDEATFKQMINKAFTISEVDLAKVLDSYKKEQIKLQKNSLYEITIQLEKKAIEEGFIFDFSSSSQNPPSGSNNGNITLDKLGYDVFIKSNPLFIAK